MCLGTEEFSPHHLLHPSTVLQSRSEELPSQHKGALHPLHALHGSEGFPPGQHNERKGPKMMPWAALPGSPHWAHPGWLICKTVLGEKGLGGMGAIVWLHKARWTVNALTLRIIYTINKVTCFSNNLDVSKCWFIQEGYCQQQSLQHWNLN